MLVSAPRKITIDSKTPIYYLGYSTNSAAANMAQDEAMAQVTSKSRISLIRFYDFEKPAVILCERDSLDCLRIRAEECLAPDSPLELTRRKSTGRPLYVSGNLLCYSVSFPVPKLDGSLTGNAIPEVHKHFGGLVADAISEVTGVERESLRLGFRGYIRYNGEPISGHAQYFADRSLLYHGFIVIAPLDMASVEKYLRLDKADLEKIARTPSIIGISKKPVSDVAEVKQQVMRSVLSKISKGNFSAATDVDTLDVKNRSAALAGEFYTNRDWLLNLNATRHHDHPWCALQEAPELPP